jgi:Sporulation and spore germination
MSPRLRAWLIAALSVTVLAGAIYFPTLYRHLKQTAKIQQQTEEQAKRELTQPTIETPSEPLVKAMLFWASEAGDGSLAPVTVELPLAKDPVLRAKQVLNTLLAGPVDTESRTLPPDAALLEFYLLTDGTAVADFSEALATSIPSGIESEQMAADSILKTLAANVPQVKRLKILIHGQEVETLAGHLDLTGTFPVSADVNVPGSRALVGAQQAAPQLGKTTATTDSSAISTSVAMPIPPAKLTRTSTPVKLAQPASKP